MYEIENDEIDLKELFFTLKRNILVIILVAVLGAGIVGGITKYAITPIYSSTAQLYVMSSSSLSKLTDLTMGNQLTQDYMVIVQSRPVLEKVISDLKLNMDYKELAGKITVENPTDTRIMKISVSDPDPKKAQAMTQELAKVTAKTVSQKMDAKAPTIIENAYLADKPDSPNVLKSVMIGGMFGFILAAAIVIIRYLMNDTIQKEEDIEKYLGINTLAKLPLAKGEKKRSKKVRKAR
ncbi:YveK family protein [Anaerostipes faecalis]|uniref:YveK family protein n=1 Tax=Anaerostipes faecalis TaxID=2738446 RepID=UPI003F068E40